MVKLQKLSKPSTKSESLRQQILQAYVDLNFEIGASNITIEKIASKANVAFGTVRYYFKEKKVNIEEEAFLLVLDTSYKTTESIFSNLRTQKDFNPIIGYVNAMFEWIQTDKKSASYLLFYYYLSSGKSLQKSTLSEVIFKARQNIESLLFESIGKGQYSGVKNSAQVASSIHSSVIGHGFVAMALQKKEDFETQKATCIANIESLIQNAKKS